MPGHITSGTAGLGDHLDDVTRLYRQLHRRPQHLMDIYLIVSTRSLEFGPFTFPSIKDIDTGPINAEKVLLFLQQTKKSALANVLEEDHLNWYKVGKGAVFRLYPRFWGLVL